MARRADGTLKPRGTSNSAVAGNSESRRLRKVWLLHEFGLDGVAMCAFGCGTLLAYPDPDVELPTGWAPITVDRHPVPGVAGGRYVRGNIRPACPPCNATHGGGLRRER